MPPKKSTETKRPGKWTNTVNCGWRDITPLREYANDPSKVKKFLANILEDSGYLDNYKVVPNLNECVLSYPAKPGTDSHEWFGVYLQDSAGNKSWTYTGPDGNPVTKKHVYYFKTVMGNDGSIKRHMSAYGFIPILAGTCRIKSTPKDLKTFLVKLVI